MGRCRRRAGRHAVRRSTTSCARTRSPASRRASGISAARAIRRSRDLRPTSASHPAKLRGSRSTPTRPLTRSTSTGSGYYDGDGARRIATIAPSATLPQNQPACLSQATTGLIDCGNWAVSASWPVPLGTVSGMYFAKLTRNDNGGASHIFFVVRDDTRGARMVFQTSDTTWQAYNDYGGRSLYVGGPGVNHPRAYKVSYNRPFATRGTAPEDWVFNAEYPMVRFLERNGYDVSYISGIDTRPRGRRTARARRIPFRRPRRVLVGRPARERRSGACGGREPGVLQRQRGLLEDTMGAEHRRQLDAEPDAGLLQGNARRREDRSRSGLDGHLARSALQPAGRRRAAGARADRHPVQRERGERHRDQRARGATASCGSGAIRRSRRSRPAPLRRWRRTTLGYEWDEAPNDAFTPPRADAALAHDRERRLDAARPRLYLRRRDCDA